MTRQLMDKSQLGIEKMDFDRVAHWENVYSTKQTTEVSWFEAEPTTSLNLLEHIVPQGGRIIDVGGGASFLVDRLVAKGFWDVTVSLLPLRRRRRAWFPMRANVTAVALLAMLQEERNVVKLPLCQKE